jgi:hypothetical protein
MKNSKTYLLILIIVVFTSCSKNQNGLIENKETASTITTHLNYKIFDTNGFIISQEENITDLILRNKNYLVTENGEDVTGGYLVFKKHTYDIQYAGIGFYLYKNENKPNNNYNQNSSEKLFWKSNGNETYPINIENGYLGFFDRKSMTSNQNTFLYNVDFKEDGLIIKLKRDVYFKSQSFCDGLFFPSISDGCDYERQQQHNNYSKTFWGIQTNNIPTTLTRYVELEIHLNYDDLSALGF